MKKLFFAFMISLGLLAPLTSRAQTAPEVSLDFFYDNLSPEGSWIEVADYGYCFQPSVAVNNPDWRPYADGYWAYTDLGWTWVSYEDFGWATYHYGRWNRLQDYGWVWVPGYEWGPAWVSWRTGGDYVGWAPLPATPDRIYEGRPISGEVDLTFDIGPQYYNFVDIRYIGEPVLRQRIVAPQQNVTIINRTVNVTNITYTNSTVYNYGPDYNRVNQYAARPVPRLSIQRETTVANLDVQGGGRRNFNRVNGNQLMVVAPQIRKSSQTVAPKAVKARVQQAKIERGWEGVSNKEQLQAEMKKENRQNVPPPDIQRQPGRANANTDSAGNTPNDQQPGKQQAETQQAPRHQRQPGRANAGADPAGNFPNERQPGKQQAETQQVPRPDESAGRPAADNREPVQRQTRRNPHAVQPGQQDANDRSRVDANAPQDNDSTPGEHATKRQREKPQNGNDDQHAVDGRAEQRQPQRRTRQVQPSQQETNEPSPGDANRARPADLNRQQDRSPRAARPNQLGNNGQQSADRETSNRGERNQDGAERRDQRAKRAPDEAPKRPAADRAETQGRAEQPKRTREPADEAQQPRAVPQRQRDAAEQREEKKPANDASRKQQKKKQAADQKPDQP